MSHVLHAQQSLLVLEVCCLERPLSGGPSQHDFPYLLPRGNVLKNLVRGSSSSGGGGVRFCRATCCPVWAQWLQRPIGNLEIVLLCRITYFFLSVFEQQLS